MVIMISFWLCQFAFKSIVNQVAFGLLPGLSFVSEFDTANANSGKV